MSKLRDALRKKFKTPREAIVALGLDESLLTERAYDSVNPDIKEKTMIKKAKLSALGTVAYGMLTTFLRPQLAMDAKIDLNKGLRNINAKNFKAKRPVLGAWINASVEGHLDPQYAQDGALDPKGLDAVLDMIEVACDDFPDDMKDKKEDKAKDEDMDDEDMADDEEAETDEEKAERMKKRMEAKKAADKKAKDAKKSKDGKLTAGAKDKDVNEEDEEHDPETPKETANDEDDEEKDKAMDEKIQAGINAGIKKERDRMDAVAVAKDHVRGRVGNLSGMAFDSAAQVFSKAIEIASGKKPPKEANVEMLKFAFDALPPKDGGKKQTYAMDSAEQTSASGEIAKRNPGLAKNLERIGHQ
jgi:hypothetical protein